ncbi:MAG: hypothetical protein AAFU80_14860 [Pseudomonadota bacterium]
MTRFIPVHALIAAMLVLGTLAPSAGFADEKASISAELQAAMQRHIARSSIEGAILDLDTETGEMRRLYPTKAHPMIMVGEGYFVLCADLLTEDGQSFEVDYFVAQTDRGFQIFRTEIDNRAVLHGLRAAGQVRAF